MNDVPDARRTVFNAAEATLNAFYRDVAGPKDGYTGDDRCFSLLSYRPPEPSSRPPVMVGAPGLRKFMEYCLANMPRILGEMTGGLPVGSNTRYAYDIQWKPLGPVPDAYVTWLVLTRRPTEAANGEFTVIYDPVRLRRLCSSPWCREKALRRAIAHECGHALLHSNAYLEAEPNAIVEMSDRDEVAAHQFANMVVGDAQGHFAAWSRSTWKSDIAWLH